VIKIFCKPYKISACLQIVIGALVSIVLKPLHGEIDGSFFDSGHGGVTSP
jgi:hypothetical protein